jgi:aminopeptidase YwaD
VEASTSASEYIFNQFSSMNLSVSYDPWTSSGYSDRNVEAVLNGTNSSSDKIFVVCGHFDSVYGSPGADDNGAGTAAVLTAAQMMNGYIFEHTIRFVAFSGEEQGLLGSYHYAGESSSQADNIIGVLNADMIGYTQTPSGGTNVKIYENTASEWITDLAINISSVYQSEIGLTINRLTGTANSDHYPFWMNGYDAIFYHEYEFNPYYHSPNDIIDNMNLTYDAIVTRLIVATLAELAIPAGPLETDVGVESIDSPINNVSYPGGMRDINVTIKNYGWSNQTSFNVSCEIIEIGEPLMHIYDAMEKQVFYNEITILEQLQFNQSVPVHWEYSFQNISLYLIKIRTLLEGDQCLWNDEREIQIWITELSHTMAIHQGWNLITISLENTWTAETMGENITSCTTVCRFNASSQTYVTHVMGIPYNEFPIQDGVGYFVYVTSDSYLNVTGPSIASVNISLYTQWNLIGWYKETSTIASSLGAALHDCTTICMYNATTGSYTTHVVGIPYNDFSITQGMGLFIYTTSNSYWTGEG